MSNNTTTTNDNDSIDQLLARAAAPERAAHVDLAFVQRVDEQLDALPEAGLPLLRFLPFLAALLAAIFVVPVLLGGYSSGTEISLGALSVSGLWNWLTDPLGLHVLLDAVTAATAAFNLPKEWIDSGHPMTRLWPYAIGLAVVLVPFWMPAGDV